METAANEGERTKEQTTPPIDVTATSRDPRENHGRREADNSDSEKEKNGLLDRISPR
jgi:hypothetical protein